MSDPNPLVTINILSYNKKTRLFENITQFYNKINDMIEVIVIDNGSDDGTTDMILTNFPNIYLIPLETNIGVSAWNIGAAKARGEYILFLDDDAYIEPNKIERLIDIMKFHRLDLIYPKIINPETQYEFTENYPTGLLSFWGCCVIIRKFVFEKLIGFDTNIFIWAHELEFTIRLHDQNFNIAFYPEVTAFHFQNTGTKLTMEYKYFRYRVNMNNLFYIANKFFTGRILFYTNINLITKHIINKIKFKNFSKIFSEVIFYIRLGLKSKYVINKKLQFIYYQNFYDFASPFKLKFIYKEKSKFYKKRLFYFPTNFSIANFKTILNYFDK